MEGKEKSKNVLIGVLVAIIIVLAGLCVYFVFIKKENNVVDNNQISNNENNTVNSNQVYNSLDNKYKLTIISTNDKEDYNKAKEEFTKGFNDYYKGNKTYDNSKTINYGYLNNRVLQITDIVKEDDIYVVIYANYLPSVIDGMCGSRITIMYNKITNKLELPIDAEDKFYLCVFDLRFEKINNNYYFLYYYVDDPDMGATIYTSDWKKLGYVKRGNIKFDNEGIYVYDNDNLEGTLIKYDYNGKVVS